MEDYSGFPLMKKWKALELKGIYVKKEFCGKGLPSFMDFILHYASDNRYEVVWLGVGAQQESPAVLREIAGSKIPVTRTISDRKVRRKLIFGSGSSVKLNPVKNRV